MYIYIHVRVYICLYIRRVFIHKYIYTNLYISSELYENYILNKSPDRSHWLLKAYEWSYGNSHLILKHMKYVFSFCILIIPPHPIPPGNKSGDILGKDIYTWMSRWEQEITPKSLVRAFLATQPADLGDSRCLRTYYKLWILIWTLTLSMGSRDFTPPHPYPLRSEMICLYILNLKKGDR